MTTKETAIRDIIVLKRYLTDALEWHHLAAWTVILESMKLWKSPGFPTMEERKRLLSEYCKINIPASVS